MSRIPRHYPKCVRLFLGLPGISWDMLYHMRCPRVLGTTCEVPTRSQLHTFVPDVPSVPEITQPRGSLTPLSHAPCVQGLHGTSRIYWIIPVQSQLHSLVPCPRCPMCTWDYQGHPGMSYMELSAHYIHTALSLVLDVLCAPVMTRDISGCPN